MSPANEIPDHSDDDADLPDLLPVGQPRPPIIQGFQPPLLTLALSREDGDNLTRALSAARSSQIAGYEIDHFVRYPDDTYVYIYIGQQEPSPNDYVRIVTATFILLGTIEEINSTAH